MYTTSSAFLHSLADAGITHAFVNWGSDHPALLEDLERQRSEGDGSTKPHIVTCPNEMVALSAAQGYAQVTGKPAAVIVHVDVGTQALAGAIHNVDRSRTPVLIYAGASPFSSLKELKGGRNEWIMWLQDIPDQTAIVRQYMRYTAQISSGSTVSQYVNRALQIATSQPKGPVYLWARREVMEQEIPKLSTPSNHHLWPPVEPCGLSRRAATHIALALLSSRTPLIITSFIGRNPQAIAPLIDLHKTLSIPIAVTCPTAVTISPLFTGVTYLSPGTHSVFLKEADTILVIDCDLPWIPANDAPDEKARVFVIDSGDPLHTTSNVGFWHVEAELVCRADAEQALEQILYGVKNSDGKGSRKLGDESLNEDIRNRAEVIRSFYQDTVRKLDEAEAAFPIPNVTSDDAPKALLTVPNIIGVLRESYNGLNPLILNESISNFPQVWMHLRADSPGSVLTSGGSSLGWALGAAVGAHIAEDVKKQGQGEGHDLIIVIVGDGSFMFGVPSSAYWMARKYNTPFLTIILNNGGWKSPKLSMLGVHPVGYGSRANGEKLSVGFGPDCPDYSQLAVAASGGWAWGKRVGVTAGDSEREALESIMAEAIRIVVHERRCAVIDCIIESI